MSDRYTQEELEAAATVCPFHHEADDECGLCRKILRFAHAQVSRARLAQTRKIRAAIQSSHNDAIGKYFEREVAALEKEAEGA